MGGMWELCKVEIDVGGRDSCGRYGELWEVGGGMWELCKVDIDVVGRENCRR